MLHAVIPFGLHCELGLEGFHFESLHAFLAGTYINTVAAAETVENVDGLHELHAGECLSDGGESCFDGRSVHLGLVEHEGTDSGVRTNVGALVTLDTVVGNPFGNECCHTALFVSCSALLPCAVFNTDEVADLEKVAVLSVDGADDAVDEFGVVVSSDSLDSEVGPCGIDGELFVFATAVNRSVVLVDHVLTFLAVRLDDEFLHLLDGEVDGDNFGDAEECALENGVGAVAQTDFLCNFCRIDIVNRDVVVGEIFLNLCREVFGKLLAFPDGIEKECAVVAQTAGHVIHVEVCLNVACHEVGSVDEVGRTDGVVTEAEVRAGETA